VTLCDLGSSTAHRGPCPTTHASACVQASHAGAAGVVSSVAVAQNTIAVPGRSSNALAWQGKRMWDSSHTCHLGEGVVSISPNHQWCSSLANP